MLHKKNPSSDNGADSQEPVLGEKLSAAELIVIAKAVGVKLEWKGSSELVVTGTVEAITLWLPILTLRKKEILVALFPYI